MPLPDKYCSGSRRIFIAVLSLVLLVSCSTVFSNPIELAPRKNHMIQCVRIVTALEQYHYLGKQLDNTLSDQIFERYIKYLDPSRQLLTRQDLDRLDRFRYQFDTDLKKGNLNTAYGIYNLYQQRATQRLEYILDLIKTWKTSLELDTQDSLVIEGRHRSWQQSLDDLRDLWEKELINHIITLKLDNQSEQDITDTLEKIYSTRLSRLAQTHTDDVF